MLREIAALATSAALIAGTSAPASARNAAEYMRDGTLLDAPQGATAMASVRIPLGSAPERDRPTWGLTLGVAQTTGAGDLTAHTTTRQIRLADLRLDENARLRNAYVASFDLANLDKDKRLNLFGGSSDTLWLVGGVVLVGVGVCILAECFDSDNGDEADD